MGTSRNLPVATLDLALQLKDAGAVTASGAAQIASVNRVLDLGSGRVRGQFVVDSASLDATTGDETQEVRLQVSSDPTFATDVVIAATLPVKAIGRAATIFDNASGDGTPRRYARAYHVLAGTTPSLNYQAFITKDTLNG